MLKRRVRQCQWQNQFWAFKKWVSGLSRRVPSVMSSMNGSQADISTDATSFIEQLDQALVKSQSMVAAQMQASLSEKSESIKFKAKDQAVVAILSKHVLHKQPAMAVKHRFMQRWRSQCQALAQKSHHQDWQNEQISTVIKEKQDLEKKVEF